MNLSQRGLELSTPVALANCSVHSLGITLAKFARVQLRILSHAYGAAAALAAVLVENSSRLRCVNMTFAASVAGAKGVPSAFAYVPVIVGISADV